MLAARVPANLDVNATAGLPKSFKIATCDTLVGKYLLLPIAFDVDQVLENGGSSTSVTVTIP